MRRLSSEPEHVALDPECSDDHAGGRAERSQYRPLLDVQLEVRARVDGLQPPMRFRQGLEADAVIAQRVSEGDAGSIARARCGLEIDTASGCRRAEQAHAEASFLVGPVDQPQRDRQIMVLIDTQRFERREDAERAVQPSTVWNRIEVRSENDRRRRAAGQSRPRIPGLVELGVQADGRELFSEPGACALPHRAPRHALGALVVRRQRRELTQIADDTRSVRHFCHYTRLDRRQRHMGKINIGRVVAGGLLAGLVINISETVLNTVVLGSQMEAAAAARNLPPMGGREIASFVIMCFGLGIATVWLYAAIRTRFGPGMPTAVLNGVVVWFFAYLWPNMGDAVMQIFPSNVIAVGVIWGLVEIVLGSIAGAWLYRE